MQYACKAALLIGCRNKVIDEDQFCEECIAAGVDEDYNRYQNYLDEGYPRYKARVMAGLDDPE